MKQSDYVMLETDLKIYIDKCKKLELENKKLKERISQALRYMDNSFISNIDGVDEEIWEIKEILRGDSNE